MIYRKIASVSSRKGQNGGEATLVNLQLRLPDSRFDRLRARSRNIAGSDSRPFGRGTQRVPMPPSRLRGSPFPSAFVPRSPVRAANAVRRAHFITHSRNT
ncbi:hypothetical protein CUJ89_37505 [Burkholderia pyrrocinia]|uniref:Uncharacterized protein n=1 Tax=Burkholderia pyrrocinia TaxID=60550 RepID=A0A2Z5NBS0_BURPY|nr:hypothetical protein CUJ89_37505 [Burkholderia pyrrocinia]